MKWSFTLWTLLLTLLFATSLLSQNSCQYALTMTDSWGDGWNGATLTITIGGSVGTYTLNDVDDDGLQATVFIPVVDGDAIELFYTAGNFPEEPSYTFFDSEGSILFQDGQVGEPATGVVYADTATCPTCQIPLSLGPTVEVDEVRAFTADLSWVPSDPEGEYLVEYDTTGFSPGKGRGLRTAIGATTTLFNLQENTAYDFYLYALCENGDTSVHLGPFSFQTLYARDVAITEVFSPMTACGLGPNDTISVAIANFGGVPQSLIPFDYSVNGTPSSVGMPQDGFFTGVVGTDSFEVAEFDATFDFSEYGEYTLQVWTALEGDSVPSNDTTTLTIINIPNVTEYPYFEGFEEWGGGWLPEANGFGASSWEYGAPAGNLINGAASGTGAWVTNLDGPYNNNELSYLVSPCLDFSSLSEDPRIAFSLFLDTEENYDGAWVEASTDGGNTWSKVGSFGTGLNWYNIEEDDWWEGDSGVPGWHYAQHILEGTADSSDVRVRFVFSSDGSMSEEGVGLDNILISPQLGRDVAASEASFLAAAGCGTPNDTVSLSIVNLGSLSAGGFDLAYSINGGDPVVEDVDNVLLLPGESFTYLFNTTFDATSPGDYVLEAWVDFGSDQLLLNDTATTVFRTSVTPPLREDFESGMFPAGWSASPNVMVDQAHNSPTVVAFDNLDSGNPLMQVTTISVGPIDEGDTLVFDYRFVNTFSGTMPTILSPQDSLIAEVSLDCGESFFPIFVVNGLNHLPTTDMTTVELPLDGLEGEFLLFRFTGIWGTGDYYLDLDNINVRRCPESLELLAVLTPPSRDSAMDGSITIAPGDDSGPFTYLWNTGATSKTLSGLGEGMYTVTVTNLFGCTETLEVDLVISSIRTPSRIGEIRLAPNPTRGVSMLNVEFTQPVDARIQVFSAMGQLLFEKAEQKVTHGVYELDLNRHSPGLYLVRIIAGGEIKTARLIRAR